MTARATLVPLLVALALGGCSQWRHYELGQPIVEETMPRPEDGWTVAQVMAKVGPPLRMSREAGGYVMAWEYWEINEYSVGFGLGFAGADFLNVDWGRANAEGDFMLLTFGHDHRLLTSTFEEWDRDAGGGQGVQPFVGAVDVVEVGDLLEALSQHRWGAQSLRRTPVTLNQQNRLDNGESGLEQRGGTRVVGQHSLELR
jgi:hypothetical protein